MASYRFQDARMTCLNEEIGRGGFGEVYLGSCDGQEAAIKRVLLSKLDENAPNREVDFLGQFHHRNIVRLFHIKPTSDFL